jgi:hypothetical protein
VAECVVAFAEADELLAVVFGSLLNGQLGAAAWIFALRRSSPGSARRCRR